MNRVVYWETMRRHLTSVSFYTVLAFFAIVSLGTARFNTPAAAWPMLVTVLAVVIGCAPIGPEFSSGTLQLILVKPVTRAAYLLSRVAGVVSVVWIAAIVACGVEMLGRAVMSGSVPVRIMGTALLNMALETVLIVSLLVFVASFTRAYYNAAIYILLQAALSVLIAIAPLSRNYPAVARVAEVILNNLFPDSPRALDAPWTLLVLSNAAVALVLACLIFRNREVPYGAD